jgi:hypothetical protein
MPHIRTSGLALDPRMASDKARRDVRQQQVGARINHVPNKSRSIGEEEGAPFEEECSNKIAWRATVADFSISAASAP